MKKLIYITFIGLIFISCKQKSEKKQPEKEVSVAEKMANAHGFETGNTFLKFNSLSM